MTTWTIFCSKEPYLKQNGTGSLIMKNIEFISDKYKQKERDDNINTRTTRVQGQICWAGPT